METTPATRRRGLFGQPCDVRARRRNETTLPKSTNSINTPALISVIERVFHAAGISVSAYPCPDTPTSTYDGETFGKPINDATRDEKNFWNLQPPSPRSRIDRVDTPETASGSDTGE